MRYLNISLFGILLSFVLFNVKALNILVSYESKCPACQGFIDEQLLPFLNSVSSDTLRSINVSIQPVPYGNAVEKVNRVGLYSYTCQHGFEECYLNRVEACGIALIGELQPHTWAPWVSCVNKSFIDPDLLFQAQKYVVDGIQDLLGVVKEFKTAEGLFEEAKKEALLHHYRDAVKALALAYTYGRNAFNLAEKATFSFKKALEITKMNLSHSWGSCSVPNMSERHAEIFQISTMVCTFSQMGQRLQHSMAVMTPAHTYVPWLTFDRAHNELAEKDFGKALCNVITPEVKEVNIEIKKYCSTKEKQYMNQYMIEDNYTKEM